MKNHKLKIVIFALSLLLSGCGEKEHDVQYYIDHPDIRAETTVKCHEASRYNIPKINCENAKKARKEAFKKSGGGYKSIYE